MRDAVTHGFRVFVLVAVIFIAISVGPPARALDPARSISQFFHTSWSLRDGLPAPTGAFAQTPDGFLWFGSDSGLYRFDGVRAEPVGVGRLPTSQIHSLAVSDDGDLWVGFATPQVARVRGNEVTSWAVPTPSFKANVPFLAPDRDGSIWVGTQDTVLNFDGQHWRVIESPWPPAATRSDPGGVWGLALARDGTVWAKNLLGLYYLRRGAGAFEQAPGYAGSIIDFGRDRDGRLWTADSATQRFYALPDISPGQPIPKPEFGAAVPPLFLGAVLMDHDGTLWSANRVTLGLRRLASVTTPGPAERFTVPQGLTSEQVISVFEDREGSIWVSTALGIERFRHANIVVEPELQIRMQAPALVATEEAVFSYTGMAARIADPVDPGGRLFRNQWGRAPQLVAPHIGQVEAMAATPEGDLVIASEGRLRRWRDGVATPIAIPRDMDGGHVSNLVVASDGELWVSVHGKGVYRMAAGQWAHITPPSAPPLDAPRIALDGADAAWLFYPDDLIVRVDGEQTTEFRSVIPKVGDVSATLADRDGFIILGDQGIARFDGRAFQFLLASRAPVLKLGFGIVETPEGDIWLGTQAGIVRITRTTLLKALADPEATVDFRLFDMIDGFTGPPHGDMFNAQMAAGPDSRIWFVMSPDAVAWIDPNHLYRNTQPPPVVIMSVASTGRSYDRPDSLALPAGSSQVQIDYTALSLAVPERVRFRYRLDGVDADWVEAGGRRQAFYTNVQPGEYRFQVIAANNDGVWNTTGATIAFSVAPTFLQSIWFKFLVALAVAGLAWLAYALHMRQQTARLQSRFEERIGERERIARELHDTLLQGFQGLMLQFQLAADRFAAGSEARNEIDRALDRAETALVEGRSRVRTLRTTSVPGDLAQSLMEVARSVIERDAPAFHVTVEGTPRPMHSLATEEMSRIAEEAIRNAVRHASATAIEALIGYERGGVRLTIRDDGVGMDTPTLASGGRSGHYGVVGMRERAERIGATLSISSRKQHGTEVALFVPARAAFGRRRDRLGAWLNDIQRGRSES